MRTSAVPTLPASVGVKKPFRNAADHETEDDDYPDNFGEGLIRSAM